MTTNANAPVGQKHWDHIHAISGMPARLDDHAQTLANLEAANNRLAEIDRIACYDTGADEGTPNYRLDRIHSIASGHTPSPCDLGPMHGSASCYTNSDGVECCDFCGNPADAPAPPPCPGCAAKDEAMAEMRATITEAMDLGVGEDAWDVLKPYRTPPADPVAEALKAAIKDCGYATLDCIEGEFAADLQAALTKHGLELSRLPLGGE